MCGGQTSQPPIPHRQLSSLALRSDGPSGVDLAVSGEHSCAGSSGKSPDHAGATHSLGFGSLSCGYLIIAGKLVFWHILELALSVGSGG
jgi:hypothetical protein